MTVYQDLDVSLWQIRLNLFRWMFVAQRCSASQKAKKKDSWVPHRKLLFVHSNAVYLFCMMPSGGQTWFFTTLTCRQPPNLHDLGPDPTLQDDSSDPHRASLTAGYLYVAVERMDPRAGALRCVNVCFVFFSFRWECPRHKDTRRWSRATVHTWTRSGRRMGQTNAEQMWVAETCFLFFSSSSSVFFFTPVSNTRRLPTHLFPYCISAAVYYSSVTFHSNSFPVFASIFHLVCLLSLRSVIFTFILFARYLSAPGWVTTSRGSDCPLWLMQTFKEFPFSWWDCGIRYCRALHLFVCFFYSEAALPECKRVFRHFGKAREHVLANC